MGFSEALLGAAARARFFDQFFSYSDSPSCVHCLQQQNLSASLSTSPNSEIICGQNVGTKVVSGIIFFFEKKAILKI